VGLTFSTLKNSFASEPRQWVGERCENLAKKSRSTIQEEKEVEEFFFLYSWDRASLDMEVVYITNNMQQIHNLYCQQCAICFGRSSPIIRSLEMYVQLYGGVIL
jgi:hypothetical protein